MASVKRISVGQCEQPGCEQPQEFSLFSGRGILIGRFCDACAQIRLTSQQLAEDRAEAYGDVPPIMPPLAAR